MKSGIACVVCGGQLQGRQQRYCGRTCKNHDTNLRHQNYLNQQARGLRRKLELVTAAGGRGVRCGYSRNLAALAWHHLDPRDKRFNLDLRAMSNRSQAEITLEVRKCILLCANCHAETHFPELDRAI